MQSQVKARALERSAALSPDDRCSEQAGHVREGRPDKKATASDQPRSSEEAVPISLEMDCGMRTGASGTGTKSPRMSGSEMR